MKLMKAVATVGALTLLSRVFGFVRDILTAAIMGAGPISDAFFVALKLPNLFRRITAEGAFSVSFVPLFSEELTIEGKEQAFKFAQNMFWIMFLILMPFTILMIILMPHIIGLIANGFLDDPTLYRYDLAVDLSRITFPYILLMSLTALLGGVLNSMDRFAPFAVAPVFFNLCLIIALACASYFETAGHAMSYAVLISGFVQLLWMMYFCRKSGFKLKIKKPSLSPKVKRLFKLMLPGVIGAGVLQINIFIDLVLASSLETGSISYLYYADRLYQLPLSIIGIAIGTALLPKLTKSIAAKKLKETREIFSQSLIFGIMLALPAGFALVLLAEPIITLLFERGEFTANTSLQSALALKAYALGLTAFVLIKIFSTACFSNQDTKTPVKFAIIGTIINIILSLALIIPLQHVGIALATSIAAWFNFILLYLFLRKKEEFKQSKVFIKKIMLIIINCFIMSVILYIGRYMIFTDWFNSGFMRHLMATSIIIISGMLSYFLMLHAFNILKLQELKRIFVKDDKNVA